MITEKSVTDRISTLLKSFKPNVTYYRPVPSRYGARTVDYIGCVCGFIFFIEAKRPSREPTALQQEYLRTQQAAGAATFVIDSNTDEALQPLQEWLEWCIEKHPGKAEWWPRAI